MPEIFILSGCRTAIGNLQGQFDRFAASELGSVVITEAMKRALIEPQDVDQIIMGQILTAGQGQNPARQAAVGANIPYSKPSYSLNMLCGSGLKAVSLAYQALKCEDCDLIVAGGQESMTRSQHATFVRGTKLGALQLNDTLLVDGLIDAFHSIHMGRTAEHLAREFKISREAQDEFAAESQRKAQEAIQNGYFAKEIVPIKDKRCEKILDKDEFPKPGTTFERLSQLRSAFDPDGSVTAGNASGINDGAAAVVLCSEKFVKERNLKPWARIVASAEVGIEPMRMGLGPIEAVNKVLAKSGWSKDDVDLFELNEAFAVQSIIVIDSLQIDINKVNVTGGAIALGHPIGASGARVLVTLLHNLERLDKKKGIAALCVGGGMGIAMAVEMC